MLKRFTYTEEVTTSVVLDVPDDFEIENGASTIATMVDTYLGLTGETFEGGAEYLDGWYETPNTSYGPRTGVLDLDAQKKIARRLVEQLPGDTVEEDVRQVLAEQGGITVADDEVAAIFVIDMTLPEPERSALFRRYAVRLAEWDARCADEEDGACSDSSPSWEFIPFVTGNTGDDFYRIPGVTVCHNYGDGLVTEYPSLNRFISDNREARRVGDECVIFPDSE